MEPGQRVHFVGIGGIGMSGIARVLLQLGWSVSGSDLKSTNITQRLAEMGARIYLGHQGSNVDQCDVVVLSSAIGGTNPEVTAAEEKGLIIQTRSQVLGFLMRTRYGIAVAGTHGKTTTSSMVQHLLEVCGLRPTAVIGGEVYQIGSNAQLGAGPHLVAEADESDASFLELDPKVAVITNIDSDVNLSAPHFAGHNFDYDKTMDLITKMFVDFMNRVPNDGKLILCADAELLMKEAAGVDRPKLSYGLTPRADLSARDIELIGFESVCTVVLHGESLGQMKLRIPGRHNVQNALAAVAVGLEVGLEFPQISEALSSFQGVKRRFQILGDFDGVTVVDDYAHNPAKVQAALHAARAGARGRVVGVFQPHRYTRTKFLAHEFASAFEDADVLLVTDIYSAGEVPIVGVKAEGLVEMIRAHGKPATVLFTPGQKDVIDYLVRDCRTGDVVICMGAGDVGAWGNRLCDFLGPKRTARAAAI
jgi:UDP-N-acetylmuramate--alanine ligase